MLPRVAILVIAAVAALATPCFAHDSRHPTKAEGAEPVFPGMGDVHHRVTTNSPEAQKYFDQGLALVYAFNHDEAQRSFEQAVKIDPSMAMGWWGIALTVGPNINLPEDPVREKVAYDAIRKARSLESGVSPEERALIDALAKRYVANGAMTMEQQRAYADAMREVWRKYPNDPDVGALFAESMMDLHPWQLWSRNGTPAEGTEEIVATLEAVLARNPDHTGANHYYIHAVEASPRPDRALPSAAKLGKLAPAAGHLVHMPSHIYIRTGNYSASAEANAKAIEADKKYLAARPELGVYRVMYYSHNIQFLWASRMMEGNRKGATDAANQLTAAVTPEMVRQMPMGEFLLPAGMFNLARFAEWDAILVEPAPPADMKYTTGIWHYVRGLAFAAKGRPGDSAREQQELDTIAQAMPVDVIIGQNHSRDLLMLASEILKGERALHEGDDKAAIAHLQRAVSLQDALDYEEPPAWYYPVRESLGYALLAQGKTGDAEAVFNHELVRDPNNGWALAGLVRCLEARGAATADAQERFKQAWARADVSPYDIYMAASTASAR